MVENPKSAHGRLAEAMHLMCYNFERACRELEWLLEDNRWKQCGDFEHIDDFLATIDFSDFRNSVEKHKKVAKKLKNLRNRENEI